MTDTEVLRKAREHLAQSLRLPKTPFPDPGAHSMEAYVMAVHQAFCAIRFKAIDALALIDEALSAPAAADGEPVELPSIEHDESMQRDYIPLPGGWELQTKGCGSTLRLVDKKTGERHPLPLLGFTIEFIERMGREIHTACRAAAPSAVAPPQFETCPCGTWGRWKSMPLAAPMQTEAAASPSECDSLTDRGATPGGQEGEGA